MEDQISKKQLVDTINALTVDGELSQNDLNYLMNYIISNGNLTGSARDLIQIRRGNLEDLPNLAQGELAVTFDTKQLYVGGLEGNIDILTGVKEQLSNYPTNVGMFPIIIPETDDSGRIQRAINFATLIGGKVVFPATTLTVSKNINITCSIDFDQVKIRLRNGGKFTFNTPSVVANDLYIDVVDKVNYDIVRIMKDHIILNRPRMVCSIDDSPTHIYVNIEPEEYPNGLFNVKIHDGYFDFAKTCIQLKSTGWITACDLVGNTLKSFTEYGIRFDDSPQRGIAYCNILNTCIENIGVNSVYKTGIHVESFGTVVDNVKDFNDDALAGQYISISQTNYDLNTFIDNPALAKTLAVHCMTLMQTSYSNIRAEGQINLGRCKNLVDLHNVKVYQHIGITKYGGYDYNYQFEHDAYNYNVDLTKVQFSDPTTEVVTAPSNITSVQDDGYLSFVSTVDQAIDIRLYLPQNLINAINKSTVVTLACVSNCLELEEDSYLNIKTPTVVNQTLAQQTSAMRLDKKLIVKANPFINIVNGSFLSLQISAKAGINYKVTSLRVYSDVANPIKDITPSLANL